MILIMSKHVYLFSKSEGAHLLAGTVQERRREVDCVLLLSVLLLPVEWRTGVEPPPVTPLCCTVRLHRALLPMEVSQHTPHTPHLSSCSTVCCADIRETTNKLIVDIFIPIDILIFCWSNK